MRDARFEHTTRGTIGVICLPEDVLSPVDDPKYHDRLNRTVVEAKEAFHHPVASRPAYSCLVSFINDIAGNISSSLEYEHVYTMIPLRLADSESAFSLCTILLSTGITSASIVLDVQS